MFIEAVSQSTGVERRVEIATSAAGVRLAIRDRKKGTVLAGVAVAADALMAVLTELPKGSQRLAGDSAGETSEMEIEVCRNEVLLATGGVDAAVGLDDLMDAIAAAIPA
jgi:hypothetical protein